MVITLGEQQFYRAEEDLAKRKLPYHLPMAQNQALHTTKTTTFLRHMFPLTTPFYFFKLVGLVQTSLLLQLLASPLHRHLGQPAAHEPPGARAGRRAGGGTRGVRGVGWFFGFFRLVFCWFCFFWLVCGWVLWVLKAKKLKFFLFFKIVSFGCVQKTGVARLPYSTSGLTVLGNFMRVNGLTDQIDLSCCHVPVLCYFRCFCCYIVVHGRCSAVLWCSSEIH